jgi:uncharacterized protein YuzE
MRVKYFADTDTLLVQLSDAIPVATRELDENLYIDMDADGHVVSFTVEHAGDAGAADEFSYERILASAKQPAP